MADNNSFRDFESVPQEEELTAQACPECGGVMKLYRLGRLTEFTCHVGHRFGLKTLIAEKSGVVERSVWTALSQSEELTDLIHQALSQLDPESAADLKEELEQRKNEQELLRTLIERTKTSALV